MRLKIPELRFSENIWAFISIVLPCQTRSFVLQINTRALAKVDTKQKLVKPQPSLVELQRNPISAPASHPMCQECLGLGEMMGPAGHRSCSSPLGFHGASGNADHGHTGGTDSPVSPLLLFWAGLSHRQMLAFGMVSITRKMFEERQSPEGSFSPRAGTVLNLCLFGSHHDTYVLYRV